MSLTCAEVISNSTGRSATRSTLHRCQQRNGIYRLPDVEGEKTPRRKFKAYPIGFFHIDCRGVYSTGWWPRMRATRDAVGFVAAVT
jgi:hypothetical protein